MSIDPAERSWHLRQLESSLRALASPASDQLKLFPESAVNADELASEFDRCAAIIAGDTAANLTAEQAAALAAVDRKLKSIARDGADFDLDLWTASALRTSEHWEDVRRLASIALDAFGWPLPAPPAILLPPSS